LTFLAKGVSDFSGRLCYQYFSRIYKITPKITIHILLLIKRIANSYSPSYLSE